MEDQTVREIVNEFLKSHGYSALIGSTCACEVDDLFPPSCPDYTQKNCRAGYISKCMTCGCETITDRQKTIVRCPGCQKSVGE